MALKILLCVCVVAAGTLCGRALAAATRRRVALLNDLLMGFRTLRIHMITMFEPVRECLSRSKCPILERIGAQMGEGQSAREAWQAVRALEKRRGGGLDALLEEDFAALDRVFARLGESGREEQDILLGEAVRALAANLQSAEQQARESERLYLSLGFLVGLMMALIVI